VLLLVATFGLAASVTFLFLGMRAVMDIGGVCADGGSAPGSGAPPPQHAIGEGAKPTH